MGAVGDVGVGGDDYDHDDEGRPQWGQISLPS